MSITKNTFPLTRNGGRELIESGSSFTVSINNSPFFSPPLPARFEKRLPQAGKESQLSMNTNQKKRKGVRPNANFATICSPDRGVHQKMDENADSAPERGKPSTSVCLSAGKVGKEGRHNPRPREIESNFYTHIVAGDDRVKKRRKKCFERVGKSQCRL